MATLCSGVQYGLSSQKTISENKDLIFVKLTDSALRTIDEYVKSQVINCQTPKIRFLGNENGELCFPSAHRSGITTFKFSISSTADMEGPGGSLECVQHVGSMGGPLEGLGPIPHKIRIHANDDVYEATRTRMTEAEDKYKNKCAREIKPSSPNDIGRKVKVKHQSMHRPVARNITPTVHAMKPTMPVKSTISSNQVSSSCSQINMSSLPDVAKRPLRERLMHLLALRPFRKIELQERLNKEGHREKKGLSSVLKQIAFAKDDGYHLNSELWTEVNEDWPFYDESEKIIIRRRKPQNLTPPGSSDGGSSGSQSPTSTHPGSPPSVFSGFVDGADRLPKRLSNHYIKPIEKPSPYLEKPSAYLEKPSPYLEKPSPYLEKPRPYLEKPSPYFEKPSTYLLKNNSLSHSIIDSRAASNMNPRSREYSSNGFIETNGVTHNGNIAHNGNILNQINNFNDKEEINNRKHKYDSQNLPSVETNQKKKFRSEEPRNSPSEYLVDSIIEEPIQEENHVISRLPANKNKEDQSGRFKGVSDNSKTDSVSPDSQTEMFYEDMDLIGENNENYEEEFPNYVAEYTTIKNVDQRRKYKADFNKDYAEYRELHGIVEQVSRRFIELEESLKREIKGTCNYKNIKKQIVKEYQANKRDSEHQSAKRRFQYLHDKLSHIKQLVVKYDQEVTDSHKPVRYRRGV